MNWVSALVNMVEKYSHLIKKYNFFSFGLTKKLCGFHFKLVSYNKTRRRVCSEDQMSCCTIKIEGNGTPPASAPRSCGRDSNLGVSHLFLLFHCAIWRLSVHSLLSNLGNTKFVQAWLMEFIEGSIWYIVKHLFPPYWVWSVSYF